MRKLWLIPITLTLLSPSLSRGNTFVFEGGALTTQKLYVSSGTNPNATADWGDPIGFLEKELTLRQARQRRGRIISWHHPLIRIAPYSLNIVRSSVRGFPNHREWSRWSARSSPDSG